MIEHTKIYNNIARNYGGGILIKNANAIFNYCEIQNNVITNDVWGSAIHMTKYGGGGGQGGVVVLNNVLISNNYSSYNTSSAKYAVVGFDYGVTMINTTIANNDAGLFIDRQDLNNISDIKNSIIYFNNDNNFESSGSPDISIAFSNIQGSNNQLNGNIDTDPLFVIQKTLTIV